MPVDAKYWNQAVLQQKLSCNSNLEAKLWNIMEKFQESQTLKHWEIWFTILFQLLIFNCAPFLQTFSIFSSFSRQI